MGIEPSTSLGASSSWSSVIAPRPLTRNESPTPGIRKSSPIAGSPSRFVSVSASLLPGRSGISSVPIVEDPHERGRIAPRRDVDAAAGQLRRHTDKRRALDELPGQVVQAIRDLRDDDLARRADDRAQLGLVLDRPHGERLLEAWLRAQAGADHFERVLRSDTGACGSGFAVEAAPRIDVIRARNAAGCIPPDSPETIEGCMEFSGLCQ